MARKILRFALFTTGGTIDKDYSVDTEKLFVGPPTAPAFLRSWMPQNAKLHHRELMRLDSLAMKGRHRARIVHECGLVHSEHIIITHGTGTMLKTAEALHSAGIDKDHTVMLVGAWRPASMCVSDASHNLALAMDQLFQTPPGIYIVVGSMLRWDQCVKDERRHRFVPRR